MAVVSTIDNKGLVEPNYKGIWLYTNGSRESGHTRGFLAITEGLSKALKQPYHIFNDADIAAAGGLQHMAAQHGTPLIVLRTIQGDNKYEIEDFKDCFPKTFSIGFWADHLSDKKNAGIRYDRHLPASPIKIPELQAAKKDYGAGRPVINLAIGNHSNFMELKRKMEKLLDQNPNAVLLISSSPRTMSKTFDEFESQIIDLAKTRNSEPGHHITVES
jgi:hypothetical protein